MNTMKFVFRARNNLLPFNLQKLYSIKLHNKYLCHRFRVRTDSKALVLYITGPKLWHNLDNYIINILNFNSFKRNLKQYVLNSYHFNYHFKFIVLTFNLTCKNIDIINI